MHPCGAAVCSPQDRCTCPDRPVCPALQSQDTTSAEVTPLRPNELPGGLGAVMLDSPCVAVPLAGELRGDSSSGGSSFDGEISEVSPGKLGPGDYELLRVVGQGAFGKVGCSCVSAAAPSSSLCCGSNLRF